MLGVFWDLKLKEKPLLFLHCCKLSIHVLAAKMSMEDFEEPCYFVVNIALLVKPF